MASRGASGWTQLSGQDASQPSGRGPRVACSPLEGVLCASPVPS